MTTSALRPAGSTRRWRKLRALVLIRDGHRCRVPVGDGRLCQQYATHVDHIKPRAHGGTDDLGNLRAACAHHNLSLGAGGNGGHVRVIRRRWSW